MVSNLPSPMRVLLRLPLLALAACADFRECPTADTSPLPERLSATGLYADIAADTVSADVITFSPRFPLWTDGADKQRWIRLPEGGTIDASDPDEWRFPEGTRAWKEFVVDGVRVETRMIEKTGPGDADWAAVAYRWDGDDATAVSAGEADARGTPHDVPTAEECGACHDGRASFVLGFSAVQLAGAEGYDLDQLVADGRIAPAPGAVSAPAADTAALGYLHANCSHCHNEAREGAYVCYDPGGDFDFTLPAAVLTDVADSPALRTAERRISPGDPESSEILHRMSSREQGFFPSSMPPLGTEQVDEAGVAELTAWVRGL